MFAGPAPQPPAGPSAGWLRLLRVGILGLSAYGLAVAAHVAAGGAAPGWPVSVMLAILLGVLGVAFTTRRRGLPALLTALVATQAVLHGLLSLMDAPAGGCAMVSAGHHTMTAVCGPADVGAMMAPSLPMLLAHLAATLVTAWLLARGEAWLWRVVREAFTTPGPLRPVDERGERVPARREVRPLARRVRPDSARGPPTAEPTF